MDVLIKAKRCFDFLLQILILAIFYLLSTIHIMDVTIDYLTCTEYIKLRPQQFFGITLYWVVKF